MELFSLEAESKLIGGIFLKPERANEITDLVNSDDFFNKFNRDVWEEICIRIEQGKEIDPISVGDKFGEDGFKRCTEYVVNNVASDLEHYARLIKDRAERRRLAEIGESIVTGSKASKTYINAVEIAQEAVMGISMDTHEHDSSGIKEILRECVEIIGSRIDSGNTIQGLATGFKGVDERVLGYRPGDFVIIAARPAMGKTNIALNIAEFAIRNEKKGIIFSLEMTKTQLVERMIASMGNCDYGMIRRGDEECLPSYTMGVSSLGLQSLQVHDKPSITTSELSRVARKASLKFNGLDFIIVDYLQLMTAVKSNNRTDEIGQISRALKRVAKELNCPVIALSQLNRGLESRPDKRPRLSDLRESGDIEQDADVVHFIYREEIYNKETSERGIAELITAKFRAGEVGTDYLRTRFHHCKFTDASDYEPQQQEYQPKKRGFAG